MPTRLHRGVEYPVSPAHPAAAAFPWLPEAQIDELAQDIKAHGLRYKVRRLTDGVVFDGRNRELACRVAGVEPTYTDEDLGAEEVFAFVRSANLHRRDLTPSQRAAIAAELVALEEGVPGRLPAGKAAEALDVGTRTVSAAVKVRREDPALFAAVKDGQVAASLAEKALPLPAPVRAEALADPEPAKSLRAALDLHERVTVEEVEVTDGEELEFTDTGEVKVGDGDWDVVVEEDVTLRMNSRGEPEAVEGSDSANSQTPEVPFEEWHASLPTRKPDWMKPGNGTSDADNPFWHLMTAITDLKKLVNAELKEDASGVLVEAFKEMRLVPVQFPWLYFHPGKFENGEHVPPKVEFTGLDLMRRLVRKLGKMAQKKRKPTLVNIKSAVAKIVEEVAVDKDTNAEGEE